MQDDAKSKKLFQKQNHTQKGELRQGHRSCLKELQWPKQEQPAGKKVSNNAPELQTQSRKQRVMSPYWDRQVTEKWDRRGKPSLRKNSKYTCHTPHSWRLNEFPAPECGLRLLTYSKNRARRENWVTCGRTLQTRSTKRPRSTSAWGHPPLWCSHEPVTYRSSRV